MKIPEHVAIIMDGNGRWAKQRGLPRIMGHREGVKRAKSSVQFAYERGIKYLTLFAFSTENWARPPEEVNGIMKLLEEYLKIEVPELKKNGVRLKVIGNMEMVPEAIKSMIQSAEEELASGDRMTLIVAFSYGGRLEIIDAVKKIIQSVKAGMEIEITPENFKKFLYTWDIPDPDLLIRTGGEKRISNFLLYQIAYTELYFTDVLWPDFDDSQFEAAIEDFSRRERRFGKI